MKTCCCPDASVAVCLSSCVWGGVGGGWGGVCVGSHSTSRIQLTLAIPGRLHAVRVHILSLRADDHTNTHGTNQ